MNKINPKQKFKDKGVGRKILLIIGAIIFLFIILYVSSKAFNNFLTGKLITTESNSINVSNCNYYDFNCDNLIAYNDLDMLKTIGKRTSLVSNLSSISNTNCSILNKYVFDLQSQGINNVVLSEFKKVRRYIMICLRTPPKKISDLVRKNQT